MIPNWPTPEVVDGGGGGGAADVLMPSAYWRFEADLIDSVGAVELVPDSGAEDDWEIVAAGILANRLHFTAGGNNDIYTAPQATLVPDGEGWSVSFWFRRNSDGTDTQDSGLVAVHGAVAVGNSPAYAAIEFVQTDATDNHFRITHRLGGAHNVNTIVSLDAWHHIVMQWVAIAEDANEMVFFVDGVEVDRWATSEDFIGTNGIAPITHGRIAIGVSHPAEAGLSLDELGYWRNHLLTAAEILDLYNSGNGALPPLP